MEGQKNTAAEAGMALGVAMIAVVAYLALWAVGIFLLSGSLAFGAAIFIGELFKNVAIVAVAIFICIILCEILCILCAIILIHLIKIRAFIAKMR